MLTRRDFGKVALGGLPLAAALAAKLDSTVQGVRLGVQTYSYRSLPREDILDRVIQAMTETGLAECELFAPQVENPGTAAGTREDLRKWRLEVPLDYFRNIRKRFDTAGIDVHAYNLSFNDTFTDDEIDQGFQQARALGVNIITASTTIPVAKHLVGFAEKYKMFVAMHNHADLHDPNQFATPESFRTALKMSKYFKINLDIGHFTAANFGALEFLRENHANITNLHLKDRKRNGGSNIEWGQGDTPLKPVLLFLRDTKYKIPAYVEYEYAGKGTCVEEVKKCFEYAKSALA